MSNVLVVIQLFFTIVIGMYFLSRLKGESVDDKSMHDISTKEAEKLNLMRHIHLSEPMTEQARPVCEEEIIGQKDGVRALKAALCGENPQHIIIYGPPGVGKTAAARLALDIAKKSKNTPFLPTADFIEADATIMRFDERSFADPLIGSVHDPIYQGSGAFGNLGVPQPKLGAVSKAHGGVLFIDEIGELPAIQINKLLKVLEDRCVHFESSYYSPLNKKIPTYIHDMFKNGVPADFRLIGATTRKPTEIPEAVRSRCVEIYFNPLSRDDINTILKNASRKLCLFVDNSILKYISEYASNGREAIKILQTLCSVTKLENRERVLMSDAEWVINSGHYKKQSSKYLKDNEKIIDISLIKPKK